MVIVMIINLYSVRVVFRALGANDYGLYQVVAGVVISLQQFSTVISTSTLRFYSYSIGEKAISKLSEIFSASINIYLVVCLAIFCIGETIGLWFLNTYIEIPSNRLAAANWIYQFALVALTVTIIHSPFSAILISYENMGYFAIVTLGESILKLICIILISYSPFDRLILYGLSLMIVPFISFFAYVLKTHKDYPQIKYIKTTSRQIYHEMLSFAGWHLFSSAAGVGMNQANTILTNMFFPLVVNAARGIALQIMGAFASFCSSFITAIRPPLIKAYAEKKYIYLNQLFKYSNKFIYYMTLVIALPILFEIEPILKFWIGEYTADTIIFARLIIIYVMILNLNNPISIIIQATGKIRQYYIPVECFTLLCPILTYLLFKYGYPAQSTFYAMIFTIIFAHIVRIICLKRYYAQFDVNDYIFNFILPAVILTTVMIGLLMILYANLHVSFIISIIISIVISLPLVFYIGFNKAERTHLCLLLKRYILP